MRTGMVVFILLALSGCSGDLDPKKEYRELTGRIDGLEAVRAQLQFMQQARITNPAPLTDADRAALSQINFQVLSINESIRQLNANRDEVSRRPYTLP